MFNSWWILSLQPINGCFMLVLSLVKLLKLSRESHLFFRYKVLLAGGAQIEVTDENKVALDMATWKMSM